MSKKYKVDTNEINKLKNTLKGNADEIIREHKSIKNSINSRLASVLSEYGNCASINSTVRSIQALLSQVDDNVQKLDRDMDDIVDGLEFTIKSTKDYQNEINNLIRGMEVPDITRLYGGNTRIHKTTNGIKIKSTNHLISDFIANSMLGEMPIDMTSSEVEIPSLLEQSVNKNPQINNAEEAKKYLDGVKKQWEFDQKYGHIKNQEDAKVQIAKEQSTKLKSDLDAKEYIDPETQVNSTESAKEYLAGVEREWEFEEKYGHIKNQEDAKTQIAKEQSAKLQPDLDVKQYIDPEAQVNSAESAKEYLANIEIKRKLKEKYSYIKNQEDAKEQIAKEQYEKLQVNLEDTQNMQHQINANNVESDDLISEAIGITSTTAEVSNITMGLNDFCNSGFSIYQKGNQIIVKGSRLKRVNVTSANSIKGTKYTIGSPKYNESALSLYMTPEQLASSTNKQIINRYTSNMGKAVQLQFEATEGTLTQQLKTGAGNTIKDGLSFSGKNKLGKIGLASSYVGTGWSMFSKYQDNIEEGETKVSDIASDVVVEGAVDITTMVVATGCAKAGAAIGTAIPIPVVGTVVGTVVGFACGWIGSSLFNIVVNDNVKEGMSEVLEEAIDGVLGEEDME